MTYFNNSGGWKKQFPNPKTTFIVAQVVYTNQTKQTHELCFLGLAQNDNFPINDTVYIQFRALWEQHGRRMTPTYELTSKPIECDNTPERPPKNKGNTYTYLFCPHTV